MSRVIWIRLVVLILVGAAIVIALVPLLVLLSLVQGGTGFGLCPGGIESCQNPYTAAPELTVGLTVALFLVVAAIRMAMRTARRIQQEEYRVRDHPAPQAPEKSRATR